MSSAALFGLDLIAIACFTIAFYYALKIYNEGQFSSAIPAIRAMAMFTGVVWCVLLAFGSFFGYPVLFEASSSMLSFMGGIFSALIIAKLY